MLFLVILFLCISFIMGELFLDTHEMSFLASFETKNNCSQVCLGFLGSSSEANRVFCAHQHWCWIVLQTAAGIFFLHPPLFLTTLCPMFYKQRAPPLFFFFLNAFWYQNKNSPCFCCSKGKTLHLKKKTICQTSSSPSFPSSDGVSFT